MRVKIILLLALILSKQAVMAGSDYTVIPTPATESMIGSDSYGANFSISVGNEGQIVHINDGVASLVPSGISADLFNVHIRDENFAVASGENFVLLWNGNNWSTIEDFSGNENPTFITPVWSAPNKKTIYYQTLGSFFSFLCPYKVDDPDNSGFCKGHTKPILKFCGSSGDIKALQTDGSILRFTQGTLSNIDDPLDAPVFSQPFANQLNLIAAWIPEQACVPGNIPPTSIYAIHNSAVNKFYHFNGVEWSETASALAGQTLTGMESINSDKVWAVGREADPDNGGLPFTRGVSWLWNGSSWQQETLPAGTSGLTDISLGAPMADIIFPNSFEAAQTVRRNQQSGMAISDLCNAPTNPCETRLFISAECHRSNDGFCLPPDELTFFIYPHILPERNEFPMADLKVDKTLVDPIPPLSDANNVAVDDIITYAIKVTNLGPDFVVSAVLNDIYFSSQLEYVPSSLDCQPSLTDQGTRKNLSFALSNLAKGQFITCRPKFKVLSIPTQENGAVGVLNGAEVESSIIDPDLNNNKDACLIDSNVENQPANRVQCDPEKIWFLL